MRSLHLVRHARPLADPAVPAERWPLHPGAAADCAALREVLPTSARWFSSTEPKAVATARLLTSTSVGFVEGLREAARTAVWFENPVEFEAVVRRGFTRPDAPAYPGWEPLAATRRRVVGATWRILDSCPEDDVVLVGHATAWTLLLAELAGCEPDPGAWAAMPMPGHTVVEVS